MRDLTPYEIRLIRKGSGFSQHEFAEYLGVARSTVARWELGLNQPQGMAKRELYRIKERFGERLGKKRWEDR
jgi:DNA-binding transcriptional regulator YiaG